MTEAPVLAFGQALAQLVLVVSASRQEQSLQAVAWVDSAVSVGLAAWVALAAVLAWARAESLDQQVPRVAAVLDSQVPGLAPVQQRALVRHVPAA